MSNSEQDHTLSFPYTDRLTMLIAAAVAHRAESVVWDDDRLLAWLGEETRARSERRRSDATAEQVGARRLAAVQARRHGVIVLDAMSTVRSRRNCAMYSLGVAAGTGRELWDEPTEQRAAIPDGLPNGEYVAVKIVGDSMTPLMSTGDAVLVRRGVRPAVGEIVVARHPDDGYVCKIVQRMTARRIELASLAPARTPILIPRDQALILGKVEAIKKGNG